MASSAVRVVISSVSPSLEAKERIQWALMLLDGANVPYEVLDACDPSKCDSMEIQIWKEKRLYAPGKYPQFFLDGTYLGDVEDFENAVESREIRSFLKQPPLVCDNSESDTDGSDVIGIMTEPLSTSLSNFMSFDEEEASSSFIEEGNEGLVGEKKEDEKGEDSVVAQQSVDKEGSTEKKESVEETTEEQESTEKMETLEKQEVREDDEDVEEDESEESEEVEQEEEEKEVEEEEEVEELSDVEPAESVAEDDGSSDENAQESAEDEDENDLPTSTNGSTSIDEHRSSNAYPYVDNVCPKISSSTGAIEE
uniref:Glutaredoxin domain-containing protein n=1 Tax=Trichuris muris TaxID=70415 RepID=A0A5S6QGF7_TRIMR